MINLFGKKADCGDGNFVDESSLTFENIWIFNGRSIQKILRKVDNPDLIVALKYSGWKTKRAVYKFVSRRFRKVLKKAVQKTGPVSEEQILESLSRIQNIMKELYADNELVKNNLCSI